MSEDPQYLLLAMLYFATFLVAGVLVGHSHGLAVKLPVLGGLVATGLFAWALFVRR